MMQSIAHYVPTTREHVIVTPMGEGWGDLSSFDALRDRVGVVTSKCQHVTRCKCSALVRLAGEGSSRVLPVAWLTPGTGLPDTCPTVEGSWPGTCHCAD